MELTIRQANLDDLRYVMTLMRANRESVGGLPSPAIEERISRRTLLVAFLNNEPCGYLLYDLRNGVLRIPQACIQYDARRRKYGEQLLAVLLSQVDPDEINVRCAADLEANLFWREMGFTCLGTVGGGKRRRRTINLWAMWLQPRLFRADEVAVAPVSELRQDSMYDESDYLLESPDGFEDGGVLPKLAWANRADRSETM